MREVGEGRRERDRRKERERVGEGEEIGKCPLAYAQTFKGGTVVDS